MAIKILIIFLLNDTEPSVMNKRKADKEFLQLKYENQGWFGLVLNFINKNWWDYGYGKQLIFRNSLILFVLAFIGNISLYKKLIHETYVIDKVAEADKACDKRFGSEPVKKKFKKPGYCFLFTSYIFWGWKLDFEKLKIDNLMTAWWIILQYLVGILCLAYLAGYIISK